MTDAIATQIELLSRIPAHPRRASVAQIEQGLRDAGYAIGRRTIERHLLNLSRRFAIVRSPGKPAGWSWREGTPSLRLPGFDQGTALTLHLVERHLAELLPPGVRQQLEPDFAQARAALDRLPDAATRRWAQRVAVVPSGPPLLPPEVDAQVRAVVFAALLAGRQFAADYRAAEAADAKRYRFHPLALVWREGVFYLLATLFDYGDVLQFALHRMTNALALADAAVEPEGFDLQRHIGDERQFDFPEGPPARIDLHVDDWLARYLSERRLAGDQVIMPLRGQPRLRVSATVPLSAALRWWLLSMGAHVEVRKPVRLRNAMARDVAAMAAAYRSPRVRRPTA
ncbi:MAG: WYL domain-containing protein [Proteobacteria bacterium]|nr:WYL domain-containing protein [Pseudomonadota bacterium]